MDESEDNMSVEGGMRNDSASAVKKPKKRSLVERELETNLTSRITSPVLTDGLSTSRYGRARRLKIESEINESRKIMIESLKSPKNENASVKVQSPAYKMHASNSPCKKETPKKVPETYLEQQIDNIYQENKSLSRFSDESMSPSPAKKFPKVYIRKDLIQNKEAEETILLIQNLFSPSRSGRRASNSLSNIELSSEKKSSKPNGHIDNTSVVKALDFDGVKKKKKVNEKPSPAKNELVEIESKSPFQVGDLAWARMGTFPFWPCIVTREPSTELFVKKKLFGRVEHYIIHVTFFGDNGRRSWIVDNMLRNYLGVLEFEATREKFTAEEKKKDPKLYAAFFVSEKKQTLWNNSVEEAETIMREPKRLRIDIFNDMLWKARASKKQKSGKITRTDSDVSLSESLYDSLFSEDDNIKSEEVDKSKIKSRNKSFDVSDVVTACLDNMVAKSGITKIHKQSHMDRWLQKAKSNTPEKNLPKSTIVTPKVEIKESSKSKKNTSLAAVPSVKPYRLRKSNESLSTTTSLNSNQLSSIISEEALSITCDKSKRVKARKMVKSKKSGDNNMTEKVKDVVKKNVDSDKETSQTKFDNAASNFVSELNNSLAEESLISINNKVLNDVKIEKVSEIPDSMDLNASVDSDFADKTHDEIIKSEVEHKESEIFVQNDKKADSEAQQSFIMEVEEVLGEDVTPSENTILKTENSITVSNEIVQEFRDRLPDVNINIQSEICMKDNNIDNETSIKVALNDVTNEASVTETKTDGTIQIEAQEETKESSKKLETFNKNETLDSNVVLVITNNHNRSLNLPEKNQQDCNQSNQYDATTLEEIQNSCDEGVQMPNPTDNETNTVKQVFDLNHISVDDSNGNDMKSKDSCETVGNKNCDVNFVDSEDTSINKSDGSIRTLENCPVVIKKQCEKIDDEDETNNISEEINAISARSYVKSPKFTQNSPQSHVESPTFTQNSTRLYVESPTFTQLLESEEFFRDVNDTCDNKENSENLLNKKTINEDFFDRIENSSQSNSDHQSNRKIDNSKDNSHDDVSWNSNEKLVADDKVKHKQTNGEFKIISQVSKTKENPYKCLSKNDQDGMIEQVFFNMNEHKSQMNIDKPTDQNVTVANVDCDEELSDDEPSPEYESLDEDITEDFRKHMMSIEKNITDKNDEEQIVKICIEIAEKAKSSPTKYVDLTNKTAITKEGSNCEAKETPKSANKIVDKADSNSETCEYITRETVSKEKCGAEKKDSPKLIFEKSKFISESGKELAKTLKYEESTDSGRKKGLTLEKLITLDEELTINDEEGERKAKEGTDNTSSNENPLNKSDIKMNGHASIAEICKKTRGSNRHSLSLNVKPKECCPDNKQSKMKLGNRRISEPKVVIVPLEKDKTKYDFKITNNIQNLKKDDKKSGSKPRLSLKRNSPKSTEKINATDNSQSEVKVEEIECIEPLKVDLITIIKPSQQLNIENDAVEKDIPEPPKVNGYNSNSNRKFTNTPDLLDDKDFDIDTVSLNSEDSEVSLPQSEDCVPKRNLRSRPERTLEYALKSPEFLKYLELKQDYLMDEHPDLNEEEILTYVYKTWQYEEELKSDFKKTDDARNHGLVKGTRHDTPSRKKSKKSQPKQSIENYFRDMYEKCSKTIDFESKEIIKSHAAEVTLKQEEITNSLTGSTIGTSEKKTNEIAFSPDTVKQGVSSNSKQKAYPNSLFSSTIENSEKIKTDEVTIGEISLQQETPSNSLPENNKNITDEENIPIKNHSKEALVDLTKEGIDEVVLVKDKYKDLETVSIKSEDIVTPKSRKSLRSKTCTPKTLERKMNEVKYSDITNKKLKEEFDTESIDSEDSEINLRQLRSKVLKEKKVIDDQNKDNSSIATKPLPETIVKDEGDGSSISDNEPLLKKKKKVDKSTAKSTEDPEFIKYLELRQDALIDENPQLTKNEIVSYLHKTWLYEENSKTEVEKNDELEQANLVKGLNNNEATAPKKVKRKQKVEKLIDEENVSREKPRRKTTVIQPFYTEDYSDIEEELEVFEIFKIKKTPITVVSKHVESDTDKLNTSKESPKNTSKIDQIYNVKNEIKSEIVKEDSQVINIEDDILDDVELYFRQLTKPKPSVFKGLSREKVCEICEREGSLVKCKGCHGMFHPDCVKRQSEIIDLSLPVKGSRKKKKRQGRKRKSLEDSESQSDEKSQDASIDMSLEEEILPPEIGTFDAETFENQLEAKMKELLENAEVNYDSCSSDDEINWDTSVPGKCEIVEVKLKPRDPPIDYSDFKCNDCQEHDTPICFVCRSAVSKSDNKLRQKCQVAHCNKYYHLECLDHWPQTQFSSGEPSRNNKKINEHLETLTCPRHVCHTCVSDDPRGCKTRFSADKLAKCVRCPATYHSFNKCLPAGTQILTASHIICPRHYEHKPGKVSYHVNTGWCFICAQGGSLICCEYCPTSFHAECLNIKPPEGNYMCEDCETGRLPLYGEMVWVKLGNYRWWPGIILHPSEIPENLILMKHGIGEFVVRFFGQYDHYWVNRGRVFPYQEGDSGRISSQKSKIDAAFTTAIEHAQRAYEILKNAEPNDEESLDIASSLLPPHYVKLKCNKPCGSLCGRKMEDPSLSLTQCECHPSEPDPCGPYSQCLNRMLLTECGPTCRAGERCNNRAFEKRLYPKLVPYRTPHRGWGLKTLDDIKAGQFVIEYVGELIDEEEFRRRMRRKHEIRDENFYFLTLDKERMIDAGPKGNLARFMNHCCEPNCETQKWTVLGDIRVGLFAIKDIPANSEVTFNYKLECEGIEKKRCLCGAKLCSGYIGAKPKQDESQTKKGKDGKPAKRTYRKKKAEDSPSTSKTKPKRPLGRPPKPKELTEIEKDLLIIKNATNGISSDESSRSQSLEDKNPKSLKRKTISVDEEGPISNQEPSAKKLKCDEKPCEVGD